MRLAFLGIIGVLSTAYGISFSLFSAELLALGASARAIGAIAAAPAVGWLIGVPMLPALLRKWQLNKIMALLLIAALLALMAMPFAKSALAWFVLRLLFGGVFGLFFRFVEYWLTLTTKTPTRGREIAYYSVAFLLGISVGASVQPLFGVALSYGLIAIGIFGAMAAIWANQLFHAPTPVNRTQLATISRAARAVPLAMISCATYAGIEAITSGLLYTYAVQVGLSEQIASMSLSACALGALIGSIPAGILSDKIGRKLSLIVFGLTSAGMGLAVPFAAAFPASVYFGALLVWSALSSGIYVVSLAMIGDELQGDDLLLANVAYGMVYAIGALLTPLLFGAAMSFFGAQALFICATTMVLGVVVAALSGGNRDQGR